MAILSTRRRRFFKRFFQTLDRSASRRADREVAMLLGDIRRAFGLNKQPPALARFAQAKSA